MNWTLTKGGIRRVFNNDQSQLPYTLQVLEIKKIVTEQSGERFRMVISDGDEYIQGMLSTQIGHLGKQASGGIIKNTVIKLQEFVCNVVSGRKICIIIKCDVLGNANNSYGQPCNVAQNANSPEPNQIQDSSVSSTQPPPPPQAQQQQQQGPPPVPNQFRAQQQQQPPPVPQNNMNRFGGNNNNNNNNNRMGGNARFNAPMQNNNNDNSNNSNNSTSNDNVQPVSSLNPYQNNWRIKVRCTNKDQIRYYKNQKGEGKVCSIDLLDKNGGEIRATMFNEGVDKFYPMFERNKVYLISKGQVKVAKKQFTHIKNDYAITLTQDSEVVILNEDEEIEQQLYKFVPLSSLTDIPANDYVDVIGVIEKIGDLQEILSRNQGKQIKKRTLTLMDQTARVELTIWDSLAEEFDEDKIGKNAVIAIKAAKVTEYGGRSLSASSSIEIWPQRLEATQLQQWYTNLNKENSNNMNATESIKSLTNKNAGNKNDQNAPRKNFFQVKDEQLGLHDEKGEYFSIIATITSISHQQDRPPWYKACPDEKENKYKVVEDGNGGWYCSRNNKRYDTYEPRWIIRFGANDYSGQSWLSAFNDQATSILCGKSAREAEDYLLHGQVDEYEKIFQNACFKKHLFRCRARSDTYQDERRARYDVIGVSPIEIHNECRDLIAKIKELQLTVQNVQ